MPRLGRDTIRISHHIGVFVYPPFPVASRATADTLDTVENEGVLTPAAAPERPEAPVRAPWTIGDILKALIIPGALVLLNVIPAIFTDVNDQDYDATSLTAAFIVGIVLEAVLLASVLFFTVRKYRVSLAAIGLRKPERGSWWLPILLLAAAWGMLLIYAVVLAGIGVELEGDVPEETYESAGPIITLALLSLVAAPFVEEVFFRGFVFGGLRGRWGVGLGIAVSGALFGAAHLGNPGGLLIFVPISLIGMLFAWGYFYSASLTASIIAHLLFNLVSYAAGFL